MRQTARADLNWTPKTVGLAFVASLLGALFSLWLKGVGEWPFPTSTVYLFAGMCGALTAYRMHPRRPVVVFAVFVPVMGMASLLATLLFYAYVLEAPIEF